MEDTREEHESYGLILLSRPMSNKPINLFGSSIRHNNLVSLSIHRAVKGRSLNRDWYHRKGMPIIEIDMSANQFAECITSFGQGDGTPCTIHFVENKYTEPCPETKQQELFNNEFAERTKGLVQDLSQLFNDAKDILSDHHPLKVSDRKHLLEMLRIIKQEIEANLPFVQEQFGKAMDKTVTEAQTEIETFSANMVTKLGLMAMREKIVELEGSPVPQIEGPQEKG